MNFFRLMGDLLHLLAVLFLLSKMLRYRSSAGISLKTQFLYALVFTTRYMDVLTTYHSVYNTGMKLIFLCTSYHICYLMRFQNPWRATYDRRNDRFRIQYLVGFCATAALFFHRRTLHVLQDVLWTFSEYLEAVAILPQIFLLEATARYEALTFSYIFCLGAYRFFYILNWIYRYLREGYVSWISWMAGIIQTLLVSDFFFQYCSQIIGGKKQRLDLTK